MKVYIRKEETKQYRFEWFIIDEKEQKTLKTGNKYYRNSFQDRYWIVDKIEYKKELIFYLTQIMK